MTIKEWREKWDAISYENMNDEMFREFVNDTFELYETTGFHTDRFRGIWNESEKYNGQSFEVIRRCTTDDGFDSESLPAWVIKLECGDEVEAYPEEICVLDLA